MKKTQTKNNEVMLMSEQEVYSAKAIEMAWLLCRVNKKTRELLLYLLLTSSIFNLTKLIQFRSEYIIVYIV